MPSNKLAFLRFMLIDRLLRNKQRKYPTINDLLDACNDKFGVTSASTIEKDISAMRNEFNAPIEYDKRQRGYYYSDTSYKFMSLNLSDEHLMALSFVETWLEEFKAMPIFTEFSDAVDKVLDGLQITRKFSDENRLVGKFIQLDKSPYFKGSELLSDLMKAIVNEIVIQFTYQKFVSDAPKNYTMHPYLLKEYRNMWYVVGYVEGYNEVRIFGIDRIQSIENLDSTFTPASKTNFSPEIFYRNCLGVTALNETPAKVQLSFTPIQGKYIKSQPIHPTQQIIQDDDQQCVIELELVVNYELKMKILEYGSNVRVLAPQSLRNDIRKELEKSLSYYN